MDRTERQKLCLKRWLAAGGKGSLECCTGFGKTRTALNLIDAFTSKNPEAQTLVIVPTQILKDQWIEQIDARGLGLNARVEIINSAIKLDWICDLLVVDEVHICGSETFVQIFQKVDYKYILCLTGTMERLDMRHLLIEKFAPICDRVTIQEAEENGWVSPHKEYLVMINVDLSEYNEWTRKFNSYFAYFNYDFSLAMKVATDAIARNRWAKQMGLDAKKTAAIAMDWMRMMKNRKNFIQNHPKKLEVAKKIIEARKDKKIMTFSATIKQAEAFGFGYVVHSDKKTKENSETIAAFNAAPCGVLHSSKACNTGLDLKGVNCEIIMNTDSSKIKKVQTVGRSLRYEEGKTTEIFTLVLAGTQEMKWFTNSKASKVITINEEQLDRVLAGEDIKTRERNYSENLKFRF